MRELLLSAARRLVQNAHYKVLAVLIAVGAWWYVQASDLDRTSLRVGVVWLEPDGLVTTEPLPQSVLLTVDGSRNALRRIDEAGLMLSVDLGAAGATIGPHDLELSPTDVVGLPPTVSAVEIRPATLSFVLDAIDDRRVPALPVLTGAPREGWTVQKVDVEPAMIDVRGPRTALVGLSGIETGPIDLAELNHDRRIEIPLAPPRGVEVRGPPTVTVSIDVEARVDGRSFDDVPVYVRGRIGAVVEPATVRVRVEGPAATLRQIRDRDVVTQVYLPEPIQRGTYTVRFGATEGPRAEVVLTAEEVRVLEVEPSVIRVVVP